jgi:hypothetical protein
MRLAAEVSPRDVREALRLFKGSTMAANSGGTDSNNHAAAAGGGGGGLMRAGSAQELEVTAR